VVGIGSLYQNIDKELNIMINSKKMVIVVKTENGNIEYLGADYVTVKELTDADVEVIEYKEVD
jgi:hypothetical protein